MEEELIRSIKANDANAITALVKRGVDLEACIKVAPGIWFTAALVAAVNNADKVMQVLAECGVDLSARIQPKQGVWFTAALVAAVYNAGKVMQVLAECGVDLSACIQTKPGVWRTPALMAAMRNADTVMQVLAECGVDLSACIQTKPGVWRTPALMAAMRNADTVMQVLANCGVDLSANIEVRPSVSRTAALMAAQCNADNVIKVLANCGVDLSEPIEIRLGVWRTPALVAAQCNANNAMSALVSTKVPINAAIKMRTGADLEGLKYGVKYNALCLFLHAPSSPDNSRLTLARQQILKLILSQPEYDGCEVSPFKEVQQQYTSIAHFKRRLLAATVTVRQLQACGGYFIPFEIIQVIVSFSAVLGLTLPPELDARMLRQLFVGLCGKVYDDRTEKIIDIIASYAIERQTWFLPADEAIRLLDPHVRRAKRTELKTYLRTIGDSQSLEMMSSHDRRNCAYRLAQMKLPWKPGEKHLNEPLPRLSADDRDYLYPTQSVTKDASLEEIAMQTVSASLPSCLSKPSKAMLARKHWLKQRLFEDRAQMLVALWQPLNRMRTDSNFTVVYQAAEPELMKCDFSLTAVSEILRHHLQCSHQIAVPNSSRAGRRNFKTHTLTAGNPFNAIGDDDL